MAEPSDPPPKVAPEPPERSRRAEPPGAGARLGWLREAARRRRLRRSFFGPTFSTDPAWDVLIELAIARLEGRSVIAGQLTDEIAGANPRWLRLLVEQGYCEIDDAAAGTAAPIRFTARGWDEMRRYVQAATGGEDQA